MVSKIFFALGVLHSQLVHSAVEPPVPGYSVVDVDGSREFVTGHIQKAIGKIEAFHSGWNQTFNSKLMLAAPRTLVSRDDNPERKSYDCKFDSGNGTADCADIRDDARYLGSIDSPPPKKATKSCGLAWFLQNDCLFYSGNTEKIFARELMKAKWNVYVIDDSC
ncbi:hypothetical protein QBC36DRAFT_350214 [Triangularia setosa]|uniref:Uncharacterized protein n=1 Tax=Triangularia setosa TaxID=2587417 RepID=A0AAN6VYL7_9PEZI|nr:hypothetical protein QBC36DRAFT_350214 [Podospora setosa]